MRLPSVLPHLTFLPVLFLCACGDPDRVIEVCLQDTGECPAADQADALVEGELENEYSYCVQLVSVESGPTTNDAGACCYQVGVDDSDDDECFSGHD